MNFKKLLFYMVLNIIVSAGTILIVLNIWDRTHRSEISASEPVSLLPTMIASAIPPTDTPMAQPTLAMRPYEVGEGETLSEIAQVFGVQLEQLLEVNEISDPNNLRSGMIIKIPFSSSTGFGGAGENQDDAAAPDQPNPTATLPPAPENNIIKIVSIVGVNDLATEHLQIQSLSPESISLEGWRLETNDGLEYFFPNITLFEHGAVDLYSRAGINSVVALYWGRSSPIFQSGDQAVIYDADGNPQAVYSIP